MAAMPFQSVQGYVRLSNVSIYYTVCIRPKLSSIAVHMKLDLKTQLKHSLLIQLLLDCAFLLPLIAIHPTSIYLIPISSFNLHCL